MALERGLPRSALRCEEDRGCQLCARFSSSELSAVTSRCDWELQNPVKAVAASGHAGPPRYYAPVRKVLSADG